MEEKENPLIFLDEQKEKEDKAIEDSLEVSTSYDEIIHIDNKEYDYFLLGTYGNGSALLKKLFYFNLKNNQQSFLGKFMYQGQDKTKRKVICAELYQISIKGKNVLFLLTKSTFSAVNRLFFFNFLKENNIKFKMCICFDSIARNNFVTSDENLKNKCFFLKNKIFDFKGKNYLVNPNPLYGDSAYFLRYCDFNDIPCLVLISVFSFYDIGFESTDVYNESLKEIDLFSELLDFEGIMKKNGSNRYEVADIFREFNANKKSYLS